MIDDVFLDEFKQTTEILWRYMPISGFSSWRGAQWLPGLDPSQIAQYESELGARFPDDFRRMLGRLNGTAYPPQNFHKEFVGVDRPPRNVYSYPRDMARVREAIGWLDWDNSRTEVQLVLEEDGYRLEDQAVLVPVNGHRYIVCGMDPATSTVLSIMGTDAIVFAENLREYLEREFLPSSLRGTIES